MGIIKLYQLKGNKMPAVYLDGSFSNVVQFSAKNSTFNDWADKKLAKQRDEYKKPNIILWLKIENDSEPIAPFAIPITNYDLYEGQMSCNQDGMNFKFEFNGKAKVNVQKDTKQAIDAGKVAKVSGIAINGAEYPFEETLPISVIISSKKI